MVDQVTVNSVSIPWRQAPLTIELRPGEPTGDGSPAPIVIFVNGLGKPRSSWSNVSKLLSKHYTLLNYNRFGQGDTPPLPDHVPDELRDGAAAARDLYELIQQLVKQNKLPDPSLPTTSVILVAHSIGVAIARLLMVNYSIPAIKCALFLDPSIVNSDFVSLYPAPRDDEPEELTRTREATRRIFHPAVPNSERFNRLTFLELLPLAEKPTLNSDPHVSVVAHDPTVAFGETSEKMGISTKYARQYVEPCWQDYNRKLLLSVSENKRRGPFVASGADHFIQSDRPDVVADEIERLVELVLRKT